MSGMCMFVCTCACKHICICSAPLILFLSILVLLHILQLIPEFYQPPGEFLLNLMVSVYNEISDGHYEKWQ